jgi:antitoxin YefM
MALIPADELSSLQETAHLLRSPRNAARLLSALARSRKESSTAVELEKLMEDLGLSE